MKPLVQSVVQNDLPPSDCELRNRVSSAIELSGYSEVAKQAEN